LKFSATDDVSQLRGVGAAWSYDCIADIRSGSAGAEAELDGEL